MRALYLVDTVDYVETNCFQQQLLRGFRYRCDIDIFPVMPDGLFGLRALRYDPRRYDLVVSVLRQRTLFRIMSRLARYVGTAPMAVYDQDPWESYIDGSPTKGFYHRLRDALNAHVFVTSEWWAERLRMDRVTAHFVRMGMDPRWCDAGPPIPARTIDLGFRGHIHPHRQVVFDALAKAGVHVAIDKRRLEYPQYMEYLHGVQVFTHDESAPWICDGDAVSRSTGMWVKDIETSARGAFTLRNWHPEAGSYGLDEMPTMLFYKHPDEAPDVLAAFRKLSREELRRRQVDAVNEIRTRYDWPEIANTMLTKLTVPGAPGAGDLLRVG